MVIAETNATNVLKLTFDTLLDPIDITLTYDGPQVEKPCPISIGCHFCDSTGTEWS